MLSPAADDLLTYMHSLPAGRLVVPECVVDETTIASVAEVRAALRELCDAGHLNQDGNKYTTTERPV